MPFKRLKRTHRYDVSTKNALLILVELLDQKEIECSVSIDSPAQECLDIVLNRLQVQSEGFYFGLQYLNKQKHRYRWLELDRCLKKQLEKAGSLSNHVLRFGVMYYVPNVNKLQTKQARHLYFLQLKRLVTENSLNCSLDTICVLASYSLQAEFGDFDSEVHNVRFLQNYPVFPSKLYGNAPEELFEKVLKLYKERQGLPGEQAEMCYLTESQQIEDYSVEYVEAKVDRTKEDVSVGTSTLGLVLRFRPEASESASGGEGTDTKQFISWSKIHQMNYKDTSFLVVRLDKSELKFVAKSNEECRYLWVRSIGNHQIFRQSRRMSLTGSPTSVDPVHPWLATAGGSQQQMNNTVGVKTERQFVKNEASTASPRHGSKLSNVKSNTLGAISKQDPIVQSSPRSSTLPLGDKSVESPFSLRYNYPSGEERSSSNETSSATTTMQSVTTNSSSLNESGAYDQLSFATSTLLPQNNQENANNASREPETNVEQQMPHQKKPAPTYEYVMANRPLFQQKTQLNYGSMNAIYENHGQLLVSSYPNISTLENSPVLGSYHSTNREYQQNGPAKRKVAINIIAPSSNQRNVDSNRYDYFDNLASIGQDDQYSDESNGGRVGVSNDSCLYCGAHSVSMQQVGVNRNTSLSFNRNREEHSTLSPHDSPLHHAVSSPELNINEDTACSHRHLFSRTREDSQLNNFGHDYHNDHRSNFPNSAENSRNHYSFAPNRATGNDSSPSAPVRRYQQAIPLLSNDQFHPQPIYSNFYSKKMFISTPELYHGHSLSNVENIAVDHQSINGQRRYSSALRPNQRCMITYRKRSDPFPYHCEVEQGQPPAVSFVFNEAQEANMGHADSRDRSTSPQLVSHRSFENLTDANEIHFTESIETTPKASFIQKQPVNNYHQPTQMMNPHKLSTGANTNISSWSISPLAKFKSTDQLDRLSDYDGDTHPYSDPERAELRRNNPAFQGDTRRSYMERKLVEGSLRPEFDAVQLQKNSARYSMAKMSENYGRNRFSESLPYDDTRVKLIPCRELNNQQGYINASWIKTKIAGTTFRYITTQNPMDGTCADFWQMVWERQAALIVQMSPAGAPSSNSSPTVVSDVNSSLHHHHHHSSLSPQADEEVNSAEHTRDSQWKSYCAKYRPVKAGETVEFGYISVKAENVQLTEYCIATTLKLSNRREMECRVVWHLQFTELPLLLPPKQQQMSHQLQQHQSMSKEFASPPLLSNFIRFLNEVRSIRQHLREEGIDSLPLVVHCATGSGASGAFVLAEIMLTLIEHEEVIDVQRVLTFLRYQRPAMVDNYLYYEFVYRVLIQSLALVRLI